MTTTTHKPVHDPVTDRTTILCFQCIHMSSGCQALFSTRSGLAEHELVCDFQPITCTDCKMTMLQKEIVPHVHRCPERIVICPLGCSVVCTVSSVDKHLDQCQNVMVTCPISGCGQTLCRKQMKDHQRDMGLHTSFLIKQIQTGTFRDDRFIPCSMPYCQVSLVGLKAIREHEENVAYHVNLYKKHIANLQPLILSNSNPSYWKEHRFEVLDTGIIWFGFGFWWDAISQCLFAVQKWVEAKVVAIKGSLMLVHYRFWSDRWDEWIDLSKEDQLKRIREISR